MSPALRVGFCLRFHQPSRLKRLNALDIGPRTSVFDVDLDRRICERVASCSYRPLLELLADMEPSFPFAVVLSTSVEGQLERWAPDVLVRLGELVAAGRAEIWVETDEHRGEMGEPAEALATSIAAHRDRMRRRFDAQPVGYCPADLRLSKGLAARLPDLDLSRALVQDRLSRPPTDLEILVRQTELSDDIGFRFSDPTFRHYPMTASNWAERLAASRWSSAPILVDAAAFGEHHRIETGIFELLRQLPDALARSGLALVAPSALLGSGAPTAGADPAGKGNRPGRLSEAAWKAWRRLADDAGGADADLRTACSSLAALDHFLYMAEDFPSALSPYANAYDAYIHYMNAVLCLRTRLG